MEPVIVAPKHVIEESLEETIVDAPPLVEEPQPLIFEAPIETRSKVVDEEPKRRNSGNDGGSAKRYSADNSRRQSGGCLGRDYGDRGNERICPFCCFVATEPPSSTVDIPYANDDEDHQRAPSLRRNLLSPCLFIFSSVQHPKPPIVAVVTTFSRPVSDNDVVAADAVVIVF
ncbi:unnamed protein product [Lactuca saligna]|uniref:Uncharacterized protein n=1 Tax=Lactuca saligna TaxID=75948 RepID=A0AA35VZ80_LACSI|nr:unnamed protein product [Lactuca saligna]